MKQKNTYYRNKTAEEFDEVTRCDSHYNGSSFSKAEAVPWSKGKRWNVICSYDNKTSYRALVDLRNKPRLDGDWKAGRYVGCWEDLCRDDRVFWRCETSAAKCRFFSRDSDVVNQAEENAVKQKPDKPQRPSSF